MKKQTSRVLKGVFCLSLCSILLALCLLEIDRFLGSRPSGIQNYILLSVDDLRADRLGCYGNPRDVSPRIDSLAANGTQFLNAFTSYPFTPPSHVSMFTSMYPSAFNIPLDSKVETLASILGRHGYSTAAITAGGFMSDEYGVLNGFTERDDKTTRLRFMEKKVLDWLRKNHDKRFFLFVHDYSVHVPFVAPDEYFSKYADPDYSGPIRNTARSTNAFIDAANYEEIPVTSGDIQRIVDIYDAQIPVVDNLVDKLVQTLREFNLERSTLLIITSDHGEQFYEFKGFGHGSALRPFADISTRVPLIFYCPALRHRGKVPGFAELVDIPPTVLEAAGIEVPPDFEGRSLFPYLDRRIHFFLREKKQIYYDTPSIVGIRTRRFKLTVDRVSGETHLFDLVGDPEEKLDVAEERSRTRQTRSLMSAIDDFQKKNRELKEKIGISGGGLALGLPSARVPTKAVSFDEHSIFLASFEDNTFSYRKDGTVRSSRFDGDGIAFGKGRHGRGLVLERGRGADFLLEPYLSEARVPAGRDCPRSGSNHGTGFHAGAIEFWMKIKEPPAEGQKLCEMNLHGDGGVLAVQLRHLGDGMTAVDLHEGGHETESPPESVKFGLKTGRWYHLLIVWESGNIYVLLDGVVTGRILCESDPFFPARPVEKIDLSGENLDMDDLRISDSNRLFGPPGMDRTEKDPESVRRLRTLGYIR